MLACERARRSRQAAVQAKGRPRLIGGPALRTTAS